MDYRAELIINLQIYKIHEERTFVCCFKKLKKDILNYTSYWLFALTS